MKQRIEDYIFDKVKANISEDLKALLVKGHSNLERKSPYICIDVSECKCFEGMPAMQEAAKESGRIMDEETIASMDRASDEIGKWQTKMTVAFAGFRRINSV